ncbi:transketolase [Luminiphilus sp.]|nr:transketolase [Luminiphilus sp.]MDB2313505.1 transketolase [Luminiphilus sp.]
MTRSHKINIKESKQLANHIRMHAVKMTNLGASSHIASILSMADILAVLYGEVLRYKPEEPKWAGRDRFILSKGHAGAGVYATLAESGFFPVEKLQTHYQDGSDLSGHVSHKGIPGVEFSTGSLGHGLPVAAGMALAAKINNENHRAFVLLGDGECGEGANWEAILFAAHHKLDNLVAIVDRNKLQSIYSTEDTLALEPFAEKWKAFGWNVIEIDGHNHVEILDACKEESKAINKPLCIIASTIKGKNVSFMENNILWHYRSPQGAEYEAAIAELELNNA